MKKIFSLFTAIAMSVAVYSQTPVPAGPIFGTWNLAGSPYLVEGLTYVPDGSTLTIEAGVTVEWQGSFTMYIQGRILALGTETDSILFTAADHETGFRSIRFIDTDTLNDTSRFTYCIFEYGNVYGDWPDNCGGAIGVINFSKLIVDRCLFRFNYALDQNAFPTNPSGGAIALKGSSPQIRNCTFINNESYDGAAVTSAHDSYPLIENNTFIENTAIGIEMGEGYGGALLCYLSSGGVVRYNTFRDNIADNGGGGIAVIDNCSPMIHHNLFYNDSAGWGGAIEVQDNCQLTLTSNTITENHASQWGGGVHLWTGCNVDIWNTILWENTPTQVHLQESTDTVSAYYSDVMGGQNGVEGPGFIQRWLESIDLDPLFEESDTCYYHLTEGSPCIDASDPECIDPIDNTICDMGAFWCNYLHVGTMEFQIPNSGFQIEIFPNPARDISHFAFRISQCQCVTLKIYDMYGKEVRTLADGTYSKGEYHLQAYVADLPAGIYLVRLQVSNEIAVVKLCKQ
jgi:hypothetical protein